MFLGQSVRFNSEKGDQHFLKIMESVTKEEKKGMTPQDEEVLFNKISLHLMKPCIPLGIFTLQRLAYIPSTVSAERLTEIANIICKKVLNPLTNDRYKDTDDEISVYVDFCKAFAYLKATTHEGKIESFEQILIEAFIDELSKKIGYEQRLKRLLWNRDIPQEKKDKWLNKQINKQQRVFKIATYKSVRFLKTLFQLYPEIVLRVIEFLLKSEGEVRFQYLCDLVEAVDVIHGFGNKSKEAVCTDIYRIKMYLWDGHQQRFPGPPVPVGSKDLTHLSENIDFMLSRENFISTPYVRDLIQDLITNDSINKMVNCPQDYVKYCVKDCLLLLKYKPKDDFKIDEGGDCKYKIYTLRSFNSSQTIGRTSAFAVVFWTGLEVKILNNSKEKAERNPVHRGRFPLQNRRTAHK